VASYDININLWLQNAVEYRIVDNVKHIIKNRDNLNNDDFIKITDIIYSYGFIEVGWSYHTNLRAPTTRRSGTEIFTLAEVLKICMTEYKEKESP
jgi:hypothetical protein